MKFYFFALIFFSLNIFSQNIEIRVKDNAGNIAEEVNVQLLKNEKIIGFQKTDNKGIVIFRPSEEGIFSIKLTSLFFKTKLIEINTFQNKVFDVAIDPQITEIREVEIKTRPKIATAKEDTITFNLKAVRDGTERTAEDLIKKLPGLDINENGKVTYKGKSLGQVLIEGNEFFGKNHKMATQNISADMIQGIDLWQNYTTINGNQSTALNLKLKEEYKGKITGNLEGNYGTKNSYSGHASLFRFGKPGNLALITDANNIAKDPINFTDFYEMNTQEDIDNARNSNNIDIPTFLNNDGRVKSKDNQFGALQYSKSKKNLIITAFSILNNAQLTKFSTAKRTAFEGQPQDFSFFEQKKENNNGFLGTTQIKIKKSFTDDSFLYYNFGYNPTQDNFKQSIDRYSANSNFFNINNSIKNSNISNFISWNKQIDQSKIVIAFSQLHEDFTGDLEIFSNNNLFLTNFNSLFQNHRINSNRYAIDFYLKNKNNLINFNFHSGFSSKKENLDLTEWLLQTNESRNLKLYHYINNLNLNKKLGKFDLSASLSSHFLNINNRNVHYFQKNLSVKYLYNSNDFEIEYNSKYELPTLRLLQNNPIYTKELSFYKNLNLTPYQLNKINSYKFSWSRFGLEKGNNLFFMAMYDKTKPNFTTKTTNYGVYTGIENTIGKYNDRMFFLLTNDKRFSKFLTLKTKFTTTLIRDFNFIDVDENISTIQNVEIGQKISTNLKNRIFQFDAGYTFTKGIFKQSLYNTTSIQNNIKLSLGLRGNIHQEWIGNILGEYFIQKTEQTTLKNFLIGGQISYQKAKAKVQYNLLFSNILNLNSFTYINSYTSQLGSEETLTTALHGYIMGGLKFHF